MKNQFLRHLTERNRLKQIFENAGESPDGLTYLLSFPRSGNGWLRNVVTLLILEEQGIDTTDASIESKDFGGNQTGHVIKVGDRLIAVDEVFPDIYFAAHVEELKFRSSFSHPLIKTHHVPPTNDCRLIYLYRDPYESVPSYLNLSEPKWAEDFSREEVGEKLLDIAEGYNALSDWVVRHASEDNGMECFFVNLGDFRNYGSAEMLALLDWIGVEYKKETVDRVLAKFPLRSGFDRSLLKAYPDEVRSAASLASRGYRDVLKIHRDRWATPPSPPHRRPGGAKTTDGGARPGKSLQSGVLERVVFIDLGRTGPSPIAKGLVRYLPNIPVVRSWEEVAGREVLGCIIPMHGFWHLSKPYCETRNTESSYDWIGPEDPDLIRQAGCPVIFDGSTEGTPFREEVAADFYQHTSDWLDPARTIIVQNNAALPGEMRAWAEKNGHQLPQFAAWSFFVDAVLDFDSKRGTPSDPGTEKTHRFLALNNKPRVHRAVMRIFLAQPDLAAKTLCSFPAFAEGEISAAAAMLKDWGLVDAGPVENYGPMKLDEHPGHGLETVMAINTKLYDSTWMSLVTETETSNGELLRFTEKIIKPILRRHPFLVLGNPHTLRALRDYGFQTFSAWIDESYDEEMDPKLRIPKVLREIQRIANLSESEMARWVGECAPVLAFNEQHARTTFQETQRKEFLAMIDQIIRLPRAGRS